MTSIRDSHKSVLYDWLTEEVLPILNRDGVWRAPDKAPLTADETIPVLEAVMKHDNYRHQTLVTPTEDNWMLRAIAGTVFKERI